MLQATTGHCGARCRWSEWRLIECRERRLEGLKNGKKEYLGLCRFHGSFISGYWSGDTTLNSFKSNGLTIGSLILLFYTLILTLGFEESITELKK